MKPLLVVNPRSGGGKTGRLAAQLQETAARALGDVEMVLTERAGHGVELAREGALAGHPLVIAVGGDGTIHEVANGLLASGREVELGILGQGTGGDFRKSLGLEHRVDRYLEAIASGRTRTIDVGRFTGGTKTDHHFVNILSAGMGGLVDRYVAEANRSFGGKAAYFGASLKALLAARLGHVRCTLTTREGAEEEHLLRSYMIAICNGRYFGGGMNVAPMASVDDATFELVALGATSKLGFALTSSAIYSGAHMKQAGTVHLRGTKMKLELMNPDASEGFLLDVDGESMGTLPLTVECVPNALCRPRMKIFLLRQSLATEAGHLSIEGRQAVRRIGTKIQMTEEPSFGRILCAPTPAAVQTAELFADRTDYIGVVEVLGLLADSTTPASVIAPLLLASTAETILVVADEPLLATVGAFLAGRPTFPPALHGQVSVLDGRTSLWTLRPGELGKQLLLIA